MNKKFIRDRLNVFTISLTFTGTIFLILSASLQTSDRVSQILEHIGLAIVVTTVVAIVLNSSFESAIHHAFSIIRGAAEARIQRIFSERNEDALQRMFEASGYVCRNIDLLCVAGTSFLHADSGFLKMLDYRRQLNGSVTVRILLQDPRSRYAILRCLREELIEPENIPPQFHYASKKLCSDILGAVRTLEGIEEHMKTKVKKECPHFHLKVRLYDAPPKLLNLRVDGSCFVEQYHDGIPREQTDSALTKCLGKAVPVMEVASDSKQGRAYKSHFDYLWKESEKREVHPGTYDELNESLAEKDWVKYHLDRIHEETQHLQLGNGRSERVAKMNGNIALTS